MNPALLILFYGITIVASAMAGGYLPQVIRMNHVRMQVVLSFVGGMMLGVAVLILLPHGYAAIYVEIQDSTAVELASSDLPSLQSGEIELAKGSRAISEKYSKVASQSIQAAMQAVLLGLLITFFMMRAFHFHQHGDEEHDHSHERSHSHEHENEPRTKLGWLGVGFGLGLHTFMDGIALGLAVAQDASVLAGFGVYLAILLHKPLDALSLSTLMAREKMSWHAIQFANACFGLMCLAGAFTAWYLQATIGGYWLGCLLAGSAGVFLCISLSDLLPEVQFHRHDRLELSSALLIGIAVAFIVEWFHQH